MMVPHLTITMALPMALLMATCSCHALSPSKNSGLVGVRSNHLPGTTPSHQQHTQQQHHGHNVILADLTVSTGRTFSSFLLAASIVLTPIVPSPGAAATTWVAFASVTEEQQQQLQLPVSSSLLVAADTSLDFSLPSSYDPKMAGFGEGTEAYLNSATSNNIRERSSEKEKELIAMRKADEARREALAKKKADVKAREEESKRRAELKKKENAERLKTLFN